MTDVIPDNIPGFDIHGLIAKGGMASVYLATQKALHRQVALKIMDDRDDKNFAERFLNEARLVASLHHPNVITIHDLGQLEDGRVYISMEYVTGKDLEHRLSRPIGVDESLKILRKLAECLNYVHGNGVIHRDVKPANILFREDGSLVLTDFGIAKQKDLDIALTRSGDMVGSPGYMSPEQAQAKVIDHRSDIYSLGVIFSEMLLGKNKFKAGSYIETSMNHLQMDIPRLPENLSHYQSLVDRMLAKSASERFSNAKALIYAIDQLQDEEVLSDAELSAIKMPKKGFLARFDTAILLIFLFALLGGAGYLFQQTMVSKYLQKAELAYENNRLLLPQDNNAVMYYQQVQRYSPNNKSAQQGLDKVAQRYALWAERSLENKQRNKARRYLERGLQASPVHPRLLALQAKIQ